MPLAHSGTFRPGKTTAGSASPAQAAAGWGGGVGQEKKVRPCQEVPFELAAALKKGLAGSASLQHQCSARRTPNCALAWGGSAGFLQASPGRLGRSGSPHPNQGDSPTTRARGRRLRWGSVYPYKGQGTGSDSEEPAVPGKPAPHSLPPRILPPPGLQRGGGTLGGLDSRAETPPTHTHAHLLPPASA